MMRSSYPGWLKMIVVLVVGLLVAVLASCQSDNGRATPLPTITRAAATPIQSLIQTLNPIASQTAAAATMEAPTATRPQATVTASPATSTPGPTATPTPAAEPTFHTIEPGDSLVGISEEYGVTLIALLIANGYGSTDQLPLVVGSRLQIPLCEAHEIVSGNTLAGVAQLCGLTLDELVTANISQLALLPTLDAVPLGFVLNIPPAGSTLEEVDCNVRPARDQVIEYRPGPGEGIFCLSQKFTISTSAILQSNIDRLTGGEPYGQTPLLIPPVEGVLYIATEADVSNGATAAQLAEWYDVEVDAVTDWNGNPVGSTLRAGQQLLISGANLIFGPFQSTAAESEPAS